MKEILFWSQRALNLCFRDNMCTDISMVSSNSVLGPFSILLTLSTGDSQIKTQAHLLQIAVLKDGLDPHLQRHLRT